MRIAYFDCFSGAAGDMIGAARIAAGADRSRVAAELQKLNVPGWSLRVADVKKQGFAAVKVDVDFEEQKAHRHLHHIEKIINDSALGDGVKTRAIAIFTRLAAAEAKVHGTTLEKVHFHEVGAIDAIVDITGACIALELLQVEQVHCSAIPTGSGTVKCDHGIMPVPAPATAELLVGVPLAACDETGELITPTGAAILTELANGRFGVLPEMQITAMGYGAGTRDGKTRPNVLRVLLGDAAASAAYETDTVVELAANLDDCTGEEVGFVTEQLLAAGALDVWTTPISMKKSRPGVLLSVLSRPDEAETLEDLILRQTTSFGVRRTNATRSKLAREHVTIETPFGSIRVKIGKRNSDVIKAMPEYDDCRDAAQHHGVALRDVMQAALAAMKY